MFGYPKQSLKVSSIKKENNKKRRLFFFLPPILRKANNASIKDGDFNEQRQD